MPTIFLNWKDNNYVEQGYHIYRSQNEIDINDPPEPIATVPRKTVRYDDDDSKLISGTRYYYCVGAFINDTIKFSRVIEFIPSDNVVYAITEDNEIVQFRDGNIVWVEEIGERLEHIFVSDENYIFVSSDSNSVYVYDMFTNELNKKIQLDRPVIDIKTSPDQKKISMVTDNGILYIIDNPSFLISNSIVFGSGTNSLRFVEMHSDYVYVGNASGNLYQYDYNGNINWSVNIEGTTRGLCIHSDGIVYTDNSNLIKLDHTGSELWKVNFSTNIGNIYPDNFDNTTISVRNTIFRIDMNGVILWNIDVSSTPSDIGKDVSGAPFVVTSNDIKQFTSEGNTRSVISDKNVYKISLSKRARQPEISRPEISASCVSNRTVIGYEENSSLDTLGIVNFQFSLTHSLSLTDDVEANTGQHSMDSLSFAVLHELNIKPE